MDFKREVIAGLEQGKDFSLNIDVAAWLAQKRAENQEE
jgi:hypothetical protein